MDMYDLTGITRFRPDAMTLDQARTALRGGSRYPDGVGAGKDLRDALRCFSGEHRIARAFCSNDRFCNAPTWGVWCVSVKQNGQLIAQLRCLRCGWKLRDVGAAKLGLDRNTAPLYADNRDPLPCERCGGTRGTELHHWAPRHLFEDPDDWPTAHLCPVCHREWHSIVTPNMGRKPAA